MTDLLFELVIQYLSEVGGHQGDTNISWKVARGPVGNNPNAMWVDWESDRGSSRLVVWSDGDAAVQGVRFDQPGVEIEEHWVISGKDDLEAAYHRVLRILT